MKRVVVAGLGDCGLLAAMRLARHTEVVGISSKVALVSGQELGQRLSRPDEWARDHWIAFDRFRGLDRVRTVHGRLCGVDLAARTVAVENADGSVHAEEYDALVISTGVTSGFWRQPGVQSADDVGEDIRSAHDRFAEARSIVVVGGGAAALSSATNLAATWSEKTVDLYYPGDRPLPTHHPKIWGRIQRRLIDLGVGLHGGHRAVVPEGFACDEISTGPVQWSTGQAQVDADAVLWAIGRVTPNTTWLPSELLDANGFVVVTPDLQVPGHAGVFAVGDVAATDPLRSSARNMGDALVAHNVLAEFDGKPLRSFRAPKRRWGSVLGPQADGLQVFAPNGFAFRFPAWSVDRILLPLIVHKGIYKGVRNA